MTDLAYITHFFPGLRWRDLTLPVFMAYLQRIPLVAGRAWTPPPDGGVLTLEYFHKEYGA